MLRRYEREKTENAKKAIALNPSIDAIKSYAGALGNKGDFFDRSRIHRSSLSSAAFSSTVCSGADHWLATLPITFMVHLPNAGNY